MNLARKQQKHQDKSSQRGGRSQAERVCFLYKMLLKTMKIFQSGKRGDSYALGKVG